MVCLTGTFGVRVGKNQIQKRRTGVAEITKAKTKKLNGYLNQQ